MLALWSRYRKRLSLLVLLIAAVVIGRVLSDAAPRDVDLAYDLGADHAEFTEMQVTYVFEGEEVAGVRFSEAGGLPQSLDHHVELSPGRYTLEVTLTGPDGREFVERALRVPTAGIVRIQLFDETALARLGASGAGDASSPETESVPAQAGRSEADASSPETEKENAA